jgi:hypothetical protein
MDNVKSSASEASIEAVITRADGTKVNLGTISYWNANPIKMALWKAQQVFKKKPEVQEK